MRLSAVYEDSESASFAGVFESWVGVHSEAELRRRIEDVRRSALAPRVLRYLERMVIEPVDGAMSVIVQRMVGAEVSGVVYTADPDSGDPDVFVVHAALLTVVKAVVSPGRPSHHLQQVARECGVPVVGHVRGDLSSVPDGGRIHVDAGTGVATVVAPGGVMPGTI